MCILKFIMGDVKTGSEDPTEVTSLYEPAQTALRQARLRTDILELLSGHNPDVVVGLVGFVQGYAEHLADGMFAGGFERGDAIAHGWRTAWGELRRVAQSETSFGQEVAGVLERNLHRSFEVVEEVDKFPPTRAFYQTFVDDVGLPPVSSTAAWIHDTV